MSTVYGQKGTLVTSSQISSVNTTGGTILSQGDVNGRFQVTFRHDLGGCGGPESSIFVAISDAIPWKKMSVQFELLGTGACWSFNTSGLNNTVGNGTGYIQAYNESLGDSCVKTFLAQDEPAYSAHNKVLACDNNADNFFRFNGSVYRRCTFVRRRDTSGNLAGPHHGRSCNSTGAGAITIINNIVIW